MSNINYKKSESDDFSLMPYREKTAWLSLVAIGVTFGPYLASVALHQSRWEPMPNLRQLAVFGGAAVMQMLILGAGHAILRLKSPSEARTAPDERDLAIMRKSFTVAYFVLIAGMILVGCVMPFEAGGWTIVNSTIFMISLAEVVHYSIVVASYHQQR